jgi:hypothetical protein
MVRYLHFGTPCSDKTGKMRILVIRNEPPWPLCYGGRLHAYELCRRLAERHELLLVAEGECGVADPPLPFTYQVARGGRLLDEAHPRSEVPPLGRVERYFGIDPVFAREMVTFVRHWRADVVVGMNYQSLAYLARITGVPTVCDLLDDETLHRLRELLHGQATSKWQDLKSLAAIWLFERRLIPRVTAVTVLSETDARFCRAHTHHPRIECIPHGRRRWSIFAARRGLSLPVTWTTSARTCAGRPWRSCP